MRPVDKADDLHEEAMALVKRYQWAIVDREASVDPDAIEDLIVPLPTAECCPVWRVHIKVHWIIVYKDNLVPNVLYEPGTEKYLVESCMTMLADLQASGKSKVNVFHVAAFVPGSIYIEGLDLGEARELVKHFSDVFLHRGLELVPQEDVASLQHLQSVRLVIGDWMRVTGKGRYSGDICNVIDVNEADQKATVLIVPCIHLLDRSPRSKISKGKGKAIRQQRAEPQLFYPDSSAPRFERLDDVSVKFNGQVYLDGLLNLPLASKRLRHAIPTVCELEVFSRSSALKESVILKTWTLCDAANLNQGDRVRVVDGEQAGLIGRVLEVHDDFVSMSTERPTEPAMDIPLCNVWAHFNVGDYVLVKVGKHAQKSGGVVVVERRREADIVTFTDDASVRSVNPEQVRYLFFGDF